MRKICVVIFFISVQSVQALDIEITLKEVEAQLGGEYSRGYDFYGEAEACGAVKLNNRLAVKTGVSVGTAQDVTDIKAFANTRFAFLEKWPLGAGAAWMDNGLPEYKAHSHTVMPLVYCNAKYGGITIGPSFRFTSFFNEPAIAESTLSISVYANFINNEKLRFGIGVANFNDFQARTFGFYSLRVYTEARVNRQWTALGELELKQSGGDGFTTVFYGIALRGGAKFTW